MKDTTVGNYRILKKLSEGGMGSVYRAEHTLIGRPAAVKVLHPEFCANQEIVTRFFNEAKATTAIKHPGIVEIFDFGYMDTGHAYLVMEFLEGMSLAARMKLRKPVPEGEAAMVIRSVCSALSAAHAKGIVHRDLKPDNIFVIPDPDSPLGERCKLLDFGIAKLTDIGLAGSATRTGAVMGTPTYMSPEQCKGTGAVDHRADLYSMGCILYELVTGRPPFKALGAGELIGAHLYKQPEPPSRHAPVSAEFEAVIMSLLEKEPERRIQSARDLSVYLAQIAQREGWAPNETDRISMHSLPVQALTGDHSGTPVTPTPGPRMYTPVFDTGNRHTPPPPPLVVAAATIAAESQPTTLSSATGENAPMSSSSRPRSRMLGVGIGIGATALIAVVAFLALRKPAGSSAPDPTAPSTVSVEQAPALTPAAAPSPATPPTPAATPATPPPAPEPTPPPAPVPAPVADPTPPTPAATTPSALAKPSVAKPRSTKKQPTSKKRPPTTTTTPTSDGPMLEESL